MQTFFSPRSVAVVGAGGKNLGNHVVKNLIAGYKGAIYPVNPNYEEIEGLKCYPGIDAIPDPVDLAIVLVPARIIPKVLEVCAAKGTRRVIIESAGFSETGEEGHALQQHCNEIAARGGIRLWGPNCMGLVDVHRQYFFTFMDPRIRAEGLLPGRISLIVQSGMMSAIFLAELARMGIGVAKACSIGNRCDVDECDLIEYLRNDPDTDVIALYLESILRGRRFAELVRQSPKPVVLLKGGQSQAGALAAMSHTSSLAGNSRLLNSILDQSGAVMADSIFQMMDLANTLTLIPRLNPTCRIAIITLSGGAGILACDALERSGLTVATLCDETKTKLAEIFPPWMPPSNPIDLFPAVSVRGRAAAFQGALEAAFSDPGVDVVVIHFVAGLDESVPDLAAMKKTADQLGKTIVFWLMGLTDGKRRFAEGARQAGFAVHSDATRLSECLSAVARFNMQKAAPPDSQTPAAQGGPATAPRALQQSARIWDEYDSKQLLKEWGVPVVQEQIAADAGQAWTFARQAGVPVVLKGLAPDKTHKTELGLVKLGLTDQPQVAAAFGQLQNKMNGRGRVLVQKQLSFDYELMAGFVRDPQFGPCVMFGLGGILAELEPDVAFALAPLSVPAAVALIRSLRNRKLLRGFRGLPSLDEGAMAQLLVHLGHLGAAHSRIEQIDINPLLICRGVPVAVDATVILAQST